MCKCRLFTFWALLIQAARATVKQLLLFYLLKHLNDGAYRFHYLLIQCHVLRYLVTRNSEDFL